MFLSFRRRWGVFFWGGFLFLPLLPSLAQPRNIIKGSALLKAGASAVNLTPPPGVPLGGYSARQGKPSQGVHDPVFAKALVLEKGPTRLAIVTCDLVGISPELKTAVCKQTGFPAERLLLAASHTHSGPGAYAKGLFATAVLGPYDERVFQQLVQSLSQAVREAQKRLKPARIGADSVLLRGLNRNRRGGKLTDDRLSLVKVEDTRGRPIAALVKFTAHGTVLGPENRFISADWMGGLQRELQRRLGGQAVVLYVNGAEGDQSPVPPPGPGDDFAKAQRLGQRVAEEAHRLWLKVKTLPDVSLYYSVQKLLLPPSLKAIPLGHSPETELQILGIGPALLIAVPGEPIAELGERLYQVGKQAGWKEPIVVGLANDHLGYFLTKEEYAKGGYEASVSFYGPDFGEQLTEALSREILQASKKETALKTERRTTVRPPLMRINPSPFLAGASKLTITPSRPVWIAGYEPNRRSSGVHDDLWVRVLAFRWGEGGTPLQGALILVSVDLLGLPRHIIQQIRQRLPEVPPWAIQIGATHTHSGPDTFGQWGPSPTISGVDEEYIEWLKDRIVTAIRSAWHNLQPAEIRFAATSVEGVSRNDRVKEILDTELSALQVRNSSTGAILATLVNFACHPEILHHDLITADFPHYLYEEIEGKVGGIALYFNGAQGGMVTADIPPGNRANYAEAERIGRTLAISALKALESRPWLKEIALAFNQKVFKVPLRNERFKALAQVGVLKVPHLADEVETEVCAFVLGPAEFATIPGEATPDIGFYLKRHMKGHPRFLLGLCNDELGYILPAESYGLKLYEYETSVSVGPEIGRAVEDHLLAMMPQIHPYLRPFTIANQPSIDLDRWFAELPQRFQPEKAKGLETLYAFTLTGAKGGSWWVKVKENRCEVGKGQPSPDSLPIVRVTITAENWLKILSGSLDPLTAYLTGLLKIEGDLDSARRFAEAFLP